MAVYEYKCPVCDTSRDVQHGINETPEVTCTFCDDIVMRKVFAAPAVTFKGNGWGHQ